MAVRYGQRGYVGASKSIRAEAAEADGRYPLSRISAADMRAAGISIPKSAVIWAVAEGRLTTDEWHHTGKFASKTEYFDVEDLALQISSIGEDVLLAEYKEAKAKSARQEAPSEASVTVTYSQWEGRYANHKRKVVYRREGTLKGGWIHFEDGTKKSRAGNSIISIEHHS